MKKMQSILLWYQRACNQNILLFLTLKIIWIIIENWSAFRQNVNNEKFEKKKCAEDHDIVQSPNHVYGEYATQQPMTLCLIYSGQHCLALSEQRNVHSFAQNQVMHAVELRITISMEQMMKLLLACINVYGFGQNKQIALPCRATKHA